MKWVKSSSMKPEISNRIVINHSTLMCLLSNKYCPLVPETPQNIAANNESEIPLYIFFCMLIYLTGANFTHFCCLKSLNLGHEMQFCFIWNVDKFDIVILEILQQNNLTPQREIGEKIGLSAAAVQRRIKRMRNTGVIQSEFAVLNHEHFGNPITLLVEVFLESEKAELIEKTVELFQDTPEVQQCFYVTGESDFFLIIIVQSMIEYELLTQRIFFGVENVKTFRTIVVMNTHKQGLNLPLIKEKFI